MQKLKPQPKSKPTKVEKVDKSKPVKNDKTDRSTTKVVPSDRPRRKQSIVSDTGKRKTYDFDDEDENMNEHSELVSQNRAENKFDTPNGKNKDLKQA